MGHESTDVAKIVLVSGLPVVPSILVFKWILKAFVLVILAEYLVYLAGYSFISSESSEDVQVIKEHDFLEAMCAIGTSVSRDSISHFVEWTEDIGIFIK